VIIEAECIPPELCAKAASRVRFLSPHWTDRSGFWTLGAATYQDDPRTYPAIAEQKNIVIRRCFFDIIPRSLRVLGEVMNLKILPVGKGFALPGFHIFDHTSNGVQGRPHIDEPYKRVEWEFEWTDPFSFTLVLELPKGGGGIDYWPDFTDEQIDLYIAAGTLPIHKHLEYAVGRLYVHTGLTPHRIANTCDMGKDEWRITLQGHGVVRNSDGKGLVYF